MGKFMFKTKLVAVVLGLMSITACATTPPVQIDRYVKTSESVQVVRFGFWNGDCSTKYFNMKIYTPPKHGSIEIVKTKIKIPKDAAIGNSSSSCQGRSVDGKAAVYIADSEFTGTDLVEVSVQAPDLPGWKRYAATVHVSKK